MRLWARAAGERRWAVDVDLHPVQIEVSERVEHPAQSAGSKVEVQVEQDVDSIASAVAKGSEVFDHVAEKPALGDEPGQSGRPKPGTQPESPSGPAEQVGLQRGETTLPDLVAEVDEPPGR